MLNWRSRLASQGITWEQLVFQFVIVVLGVYLAIAFEGRAEDRARVAQAHDLLERVLKELTLDESHIKEIMAGAELKAWPLTPFSFLPRMIPTATVMRFTRSSMDRSLPPRPSTRDMRPTRPSFPGAS